MKSGISFCDKTVLKKNLTRFAPAWGLYGVGLVMILMTLAEPGRPANYAANAAETLSAMAAVSFFYALVCAQLLYGDLYNSRMCNALHALPLRRETWFFTNLVSGFLFCLVPNLTVTLLSIAMAPEAAHVFVFWLGGTALQFLFFFGLATLCAYTVGSRFAMAVVYLIVNFFALIAGWLVDTLYVPLLYGVVPDDTLFFWLTPLPQMLRHNYMNVSTYNYELNGLRGGISWTFESGWGYLAICTAVGVGFLALALRCYRRRDLEKAGDFMTVRGLGGVFLVVYTLCVGTCCYLFFDIFLGNETDIFLLLGFAIGFFTGLMLLRRSVRVFRLKAIGGFGLFLAVFFLSFGITKLDPMGISRWVPEAEKVEHVSIATDGVYYAREDGTIWDDIRQIEEIRSVHQYAIENRGNPGDVPVTLIYQLKDGGTVTREYDVPMNSEAGQILRKYFSSPEFVLGWVYTGDSQVFRVEFQDPGVALEDPEVIRSFLDAVIADCEAGHLVQSWRYTQNKEFTGWFTMATYSSDDLHYYRDVRFTEEAENIQAWLREHGIQPEKWG